MRVCATIGSIGANSMLYVDVTPRNNGLRAKSLWDQAPSGGPTIRVPCRAAIVPSSCGSTSVGTVGITRSSAGAPISENIFSCPAPPGVINNSRREPSASNLKCGPFLEGRTQGLMDTNRVDRLKREIAGLCNQALDIPTFFERARQAIVRSVPHDGCCWMTFDPATLLPTSHIPYRSIPPEQVPRLAQNEYAEEDVNKFADLWRRIPNVGTIGEATKGNRDESIRYRVLLKPNGFENELRGVFRHDAACWGGAAFYRSDDMPDFTIQEALDLASISELMADGIRRAGVDSSCSDRGSDRCSRPHPRRCSGRCRSDESRSQSLA